NFPLIPFFALFHLALRPLYIGIYVHGWLWFHGVAVSTQDSESCDPGSNPGGTFLFFAIIFGRPNSTVTRDIWLCSMWVCGRCEVYICGPDLWHHRTLEQARNTIPKRSISGSSWYFTSP